MFGCQCDWCGTTYETPIWGEPFYCPDCAYIMACVDWVPRWVMSA